MAPQILKSRSKHERFLHSPAKEVMSFLRHNLILYKLIPSLNTAAMSKTYFPAGKFKISPGLDIYRAQAILALIKILCYFRK
jgi:hypothetical protein